MKISVKRSGGFAGLSQEIAAVDTTQLDAAVAQQLENLVQSLGFFDLPATMPGGGVGADMFHYEIAVGQGDQPHTVAFDDDGSPQTAPLRQLVETLTHLS